MSYFLDRWFRRGAAMRKLHLDYEQLEMDFRISVVNLAAANNEINRLKLEAEDATAALRESELARRQLEFDLSEARRDKDSCISHAWKLVGVINELQGKLARFKRVKGAGGKFVRVSV